MKTFDRVRRWLSLGALIAIICLLSACGGGSGSSGSISSGGGGSNGGGGSSGGGGTGGGGGGGNPSPPSISMIAPSSIMTDVPLAILNVYGQNLDAGQVYFDNIPSPGTSGGNPIQAQVPNNLPTLIGVHQITIHYGSGNVSNAVPFTVYTAPNHR